MGSIFQHDNAFRVLGMIRNNHAKLPKKDIFE